jgi:hypothetical protein
VQSFDLDKTDWNDDSSRKILAYLENNTRSHHFQEGYLMRTQWIFLVIIFLIMQISANSPEYKMAFQDREFMMESIHQVLTADLDGDRHPEMVVTGKNYTTQEFFIYWLGLSSDFKPAVKWQSPNLFEDLSVLWVSAGKFISDQRQLLAITSKNLYFYKADQEGLSLAKQEVHNFSKILSVASGDVNGDGRDELVIARIGKVGKKFYEGSLQVWQLNNDKPVLLGESELLGNIRSITAGDLDGDGKSEILADEGQRFAPGNIHILSFNENKFTEIYCAKKLVASAVYSMIVAGFPEGIRLLTASSGGKVNFFAWKDNTLTPVATALPFEGELVSVAALSTGEGRLPELIVVGYPQNFSILTQNEGMN